MDAVQKACEDLLELVDEVDDESGALAEASIHWREGTSHASAEALEQQLLEIEGLFPEVEDDEDIDPEQVAVASTIVGIRNAIVRRELLLDDVNALGVEVKAKNVELSEAADDAVNRINKVLDDVRLRLDTLLNLPVLRGGEDGQNHRSSQALSDAAGVRRSSSFTQRRVSRRSRPVAAPLNWGNIGSRVGAFNTRYAKMKAREKRLRRFRMPRYARLDFSNVKSRIDTSMPKSMREMVKRRKQGPAPDRKKSLSSAAIDVRNVGSKIDTNLSRRASEALVRRPSTYVEGKSQREGTTAERTSMAMSLKGMLSSWALSLFSPQDDFRRKLSEIKPRDPLDDAVAQAVKDCGGQNLFKVR